MGEAGVDRFHIAHVLNHRSVTHSTVTAIYDRYRYDKEKRAALETWTRLLAEVVKPGAAVPVQNADTVRASSEVRRGKGEPELKRRNVGRHVITGSAGPSDGFGVQNH